jgi:hypothetical protein
MDTFDPKVWWASRTLWGLIVSIIGKVAAIGHYELSGEAQAGLVELIMLGVSLVGDAIAWWSRVNATQPIGKP